jgi:hypothetical protein
MVRKLIRGKLKLGVLILPIGALVVGLILNSGIVTILGLVAIGIFAMAIIPYGKSHIVGAAHHPGHVDPGVFHGFHDISSGSAGSGDVGPNP